MSFPRSVPLVLVGEIEVTSSFLSLPRVTTYMGHVSGRSWSHGVTQVQSQGFSCISTLRRTLGDAELVGKVKDCSGWFCLKVFKNLS